MADIEWINDKETNEISGELSDLKYELIEQSAKYEKSDIYIYWKSIWISTDFIINYINKLKDIYGTNEIKAEWIINNDVKEMIFWDFNTDSREIISWGINESEITNDVALILLYMKNLTNNNFVEICRYFWDIVGIVEEQRKPYVINKNFGDDINSSVSTFLHIIKKYWDKSLIYLNFFFCKKEIYNIDHWEKTIGWIPEIIFRWMATNFFEIFINEPEASNLLDFINKYPQKLDNLWWKEVKSIELNKEEWFNFCFRWILEMVKSRDDIDFPRLWQNPTDDEKKQWKDEWEKIIHEYEVLIRNYISMDYDIDNNGEKHEKEKDITFWKIFYASPIGDEVVDMYNVPKESLQRYTKNKITDYSFKVNKYDRHQNLVESGISNEDVKKLWQQMLIDIENYARKNPNEDILVYIEQHGDRDWSSGNWRTKDDWIKLSNISPRIKIFSCRCYFWTAYENKNIYNHLSSVSWFSNESATNWRINSVINQALDKWVWFNELEILSRLNYNLSITSLTETMEYTNRNTWEDEIGKIGLAQNNEKQNGSFDNHA